MQISHAGRQTQVKVNPHPKAPSAVQLALPGGQFGMPVPLTEPEILDLIARWAHAAVVSREAGFGGVQIHAAHGYLVSQFLSPLANRRTDAWGGSLENRARLLVEIVKAVRAAVGPDFGVGVKLNSADFQKGGFAFEDCITVAGWLKDLKVDLLEISGGTYEQPAMMDMAGLEPPDTPKQASTAAREAYFVELAKSLMAGRTPPLLVTGGFRSRVAMEQALSTGIAMVGVARPLVRHPRCCRRPARRAELHNCRGPKPSCASAPAGSAPTPRSRSCALSTALPPRPGITSSSGASPPAIPPNPASIRSAPFSPNSARTSCVWVRRTARGLPCSAGPLCPGQCVGRS